VLENNALTGAIPPELGQLQNLRELNLRRNDLTGGIPVQLGTLTKLRNLYLSDNALSGPIPPELGNLARLSNLWLDQNDLTGQIPAAVGNLASATGLNLYSNSLTGPIPASLGNMLQLQYCNIYDNQLSGEIPPELGNLQQLRSFGADHNLLTGPIPPALGNLSNLELLILQHNQLSGSIPVELGNLSKLRELRLGHNHLTGRIPAEIGHLVSPVSLFLAENALTGPVPDTFLNLTHLAPYSLNLSYNGLSAPSQAVLDFLNNLTGNFLATQTVPPGNLRFTCQEGSALLRWDWIEYRDPNCHYRVWQQLAGGSWIMLEQTASPWVTEFTLAGVAPDTPYRIALQSVTEPHAINENRVESEFGPTLLVHCGPLASAQTVYFPRLAYAPGAWVEGYGFVNAGAQDAVVSFTAYGEDGAMAAASDPFGWFAGEQGAYQSDWLLGLEGASDGWVKAESTKAGLLGFFLTQHFAGRALTGLDGAAVWDTPAAEAVLPRVQASGRRATDVCLATPGDAAVQVTLTGVDGADVLAGGTETIPPHGLYRFDAAPRFGQSWDGSLAVDAGGSIVGNAIVRDGDVAIAAVDLLPLAGAATTLFAPHAVLFPGVYYTEVNLYNPDVVAVEVVISAFRADGSLITFVQITLPPGQVVTLRDEALGLPAGENTDGWLKFDSQGGPILGCLTFGHPVDGHYQSTLPLQAAPGADIYFAQVATGNVGGVAFFTGLAVVNPSKAAVDVTISVHDSYGTLLGQVTRTLAKWEKYVRLGHLIEGIGTLPPLSSGYLHVTATSPVFSFVLFGDEPLNFLSAVPAQLK